MNVIDICDQLKSGGNSNLKPRSNVKWGSKITIPHCDYVTF
jgi:hypothetical protein